MLKTKEVRPASTSSTRWSGVKRLYSFSPCRCSLAALFRIRQTAPRRPPLDANGPAAADEERRRHAGVAALLKEVRLCSSGGRSTGSAKARASKSVDCLLIAAEDRKGEEGSLRVAGSRYVGDVQARSRVGAADASGGRAAEGADRQDLSGYASIDGGKSGDGVLWRAEGGDGTERVERVYEW